jgi:hypothetical protein
MLLQLIQSYEGTGIGLKVSFPYCGVKGKHFGPWSPWYALNHILRPDLQRMKDGRHGRSERAGHRLGGGAAVLSHWGNHPRCGDRQLVYGFASYLIDVHKRKDNLRGKQGKESTRETYDSQPLLRRLVVTSRMA